MLVTCKKCNKKIDRDKAYKVSINNKNSYYCNHQEYEKIQSEKESRSKVIDLSFQILGETTNTSLMRELKSIADVHSYEKVKLFLESNYENLIRLMNKEFNNEYGKIRYYSAIIKNKIGDFIPEVKEDEYLNNIEFVRYNFKSTNKKSFNQFIDEY